MCKHSCNKKLLSKYTCASPSNALISRCHVYSRRMFWPFVERLKFNLLQKDPKHQRHRLAGLSFPYREMPRAQGGDLLEKQYIYEGICADLRINTNTGKLLSHHTPYYDNMFLITVFVVPVVHTIWIDVMNLASYWHASCLLSTPIWSRSSTNTRIFTTTLSLVYLRVFWKFHKWNKWYFKYETLTTNQPIEVTFWAFCFDYDNTRRE